MAIVYLGIGSNLGDRKTHVNKAIHLLETNGVRIVKISTLIETDPVGGPPGQGKYLNGALKAETHHSPQELLKIIKGIEQHLGRIKTVRNGPRPIDIDILLYDNLSLKSKHLTIPHPRMNEREFVLKPLKEIEPDLIAI